MSLEGYKETKLGPIPENWDFCVLDELVTVKDGTHQTPTYTESGVPFLRVTDIQNSKINLSDVKYISEKEHKELTRRCKPKKGDILYSKNGTIGITRIIDWDWEFSIFVSLALLKIKDQNRVYTKFLSYYLSSWLAKREIYRGSKQGTVTNLHLEEIRKFRVLLPPLTEQYQIAEILDTWDEAITLTEQLIAARQRRKKALMQRLLTGLVRLPGFDGKWREVRLKDLVFFGDAGVSVNSEDRPKQEGEFGILKTSAVTYGKFDVHKHKTILKSEEHRLTAKPKKDSILISRMNTIAFVGASAYVDQDYEDIFLPDRLWQILKKSDKCSMRWLSYLLASPEMRAKISNIASGTSGSMKNITKPGILKLEVPLPSSEEQRAIAAVLQACDEEIELLGQKLTALKRQKKGLMQQLLTGRVRVK